MWKILPFFLMLFAGCESKRVIYTPTGYNITDPEDFELGTKLNEVSGICWINDSLMLANNDETGKIFAIKLDNMQDFKYRDVKFGSKDDYEDIVKVDSAIYVLVSTGKILKVTNYNDGDNIRTEVAAELPGKQNEFESLYYDKEVNSLIMLCKDCHREKNAIRSAYRYDLATNKLIDSPYYRLSLDELRIKMNDNSVEFRPSAASVNPKDNKVYMVSAIGKMMVVTDKKGKIEQAFRISGLLFPQPEGIAFADNGDMFISNEIATEQRATLLKFPYDTRNITQKK